MLTFLSFMIKLFSGFFALFLAASAFLMRCRASVKNTKQTNKKTPVCLKKTQHLAISDYLP